jgi:ligand-binding sensor domain-containing protein
VKWFGTDSGVSCYDGNAWTTFTSELNYYLTSNDILSIFPIKEFKMYFGTLGGGVSRFDSITQATPITTSLASDVIASDVVYSIYATKKGDEWFGTDSGLSHHTGEYPEVGWTTYTVADGLADNTVRSILAENDSLIWIGTNNGLNRFDGKNWLKFTTVEGLAGNRVLSIAKEEDGSFWFGTNSGISHYIPSGTSVKNHKSNPSPLSITGIYPNPFNMNTTISFNVPSDGFVELEVYNLAGQKIRSLFSSWARSGSKQIVWDGNDSHGLYVSSGIYIARLNMGGFYNAKKMTVIK